MEDNSIITSEGKGRVYDSSTSSCAGGRGGGGTGGRGGGPDVATSQYPSSCSFII